MFKLRMAFTVLAATALLGGCSDLTDLDVENPNSPDAARALTSPSDVEASIGSSYYNWHLNQKDAYPGWALSVASGENTSSWGNFGMQDWGTIPRMTYQNNSSYGYRGVNQSPWYRLYTVISQVNDGLQAVEAGMKFGDEGADTERAKAFAKFTQGLSYGYLALLYDQAFVVDERADLTSIEFKMVPYADVMKEAIKMLDEAAQIASANQFTIPENWMPTGGNFTGAQLARLAKSYTARFLAQVARSPEERAAVNWSDVIARANQGITQDFTLVYDGDTWWEYNKNYAANGTWQRASYFTIGETDKSGGYQKWLNTPPQERESFQIVTDDRRITGAGGPTTAGKDFRYWSGSCPFRADRGTYFCSSYMNIVYSYLWPTFAGTIPLFKVTELDLLKAEAHLRANQKDAAVPFINKTRVARGELAPALGSETVDALMAKMQYEKRIELWVVSFGNHYFDGRGWGRLLTGTPIHVPVPARELETLGMQLYTFGGSAGGAAK
ncbi:MAG TPA: RagB/SusD family nutrient uptake outer membrane protein [Longimicrobiales bacterium]|nr:RagB/SusD family nutrient uptake outer membrane protein [Longimicrobiales bacterium]